ncbi:hypothetical protein HJB90_31530, partial [Rhizobium sp. NLR10a]|uniref:hypothetical protein n=1 Tax=unclassified Rhizobium TaxID=2613769 RepID=UPI001C828470
ETQADWRLLVCVLGASLERVLVTAFGSVGYLTIEDWKKEKRGRRSLRDRQRCWFLERDFGGHVYQEKLHWFSEIEFRLGFLEDRCEVLVDSERDVMPMIEFST